MAESSYPWDGNTIGDAVYSPYDAASNMAVLFACLAGIRGLPNFGGVIRHLGSELLVSGVASPVTIGNGEALVTGTRYVLEPGTTMTIPTPSGATRIDRIVVRKDWTAKTVRLFRVAGTEGAGAPAHTQSFGVIWDIVLCQLSITTGGVITCTDYRELLPIGSATIVGASNQRPLNFVPVSPPSAATALSGGGFVGPSLVTLTGLPASAVRVKLTVFFSVGANIDNALSFYDTVGAAVQTFSVVKTSSGVGLALGNGDVAALNSQVYYKMEGGANVAWTANVYVTGYWEYM